MQEFSLSLLLPAVHTEPPAFTTACAEVCVIMAHNKEHKEHCSFFADSIQLYLWKTGASIQCLKEVLTVLQHFICFLSKYDQQQAMS